MVHERARRAGPATVGLHVHACACMHVRHRHALARYATACTSTCTHACHTRAGDAGRHCREPASAQDPARAHQVPGQDVQRVAHCHPAAGEPRGHVPVGHAVLRRARGAVQAGVCGARGGTRADARARTRMHAHTLHHTSAPATQQGTPGPGSRHSGRAGLPRLATCVTTAPPTTARPPFTCAGQRGGHAVRAVAAAVQDGRHALRARARPDGAPGAGAGAAGRGGAAQGAGGGGEGRVRGVHTGLNLHFVLELVCKGPAAQWWQPPPACTQRRLPRFV